MLYSAKQTYFIHIVSIAFMDSVKKADIKKILGSATSLSHEQQVYKIHRHKNVLKKGLKERKFN